MIVRRLVHTMGYRYRLHNAKLPGTPDIVLTRHRKVILVHGCFWHRHDCPDGRKATEVQDRVLGAEAGTQPEARRG